MIEGEGRVAVDQPRDGSGQRGRRWGRCRGSQRKDMLRREGRVAFVL